MENRAPSRRSGQRVAATAGRAFAAGDKPCLHPGRGTGDPPRGRSVTFRFLIMEDVDGPRPPVTGLSGETVVQEPLVVV
jgi:hypothetical protein